MKIYAILVSILILTGCYGVNEKTSEIGPINTDCIAVEGWDKIMETYSVNMVEDSIFLSKITEIEDMPFDTDILYFRNSPKELIAISSDHSSVRYVYNPMLSTRILDGLSNGFDDREKNRVVNRVQRIIIEYQCDEGKSKSLKLMERSQ